MKGLGGGGYTKANYKLRIFYMFLDICSTSINFKSNEGADISLVLHSNTWDTLPEHPKLKKASVLLIRSSGISQCHDECKAVTMLTRRL